MTIQLFCPILLTDEWLQFQRFSIPGLAGYPFVNVKSENNVDSLANLICRMVQLLPFSLPLSSFRHQRWFWPVLNSSSILGVLPTSLVIPKPQLPQLRLNLPSISLIVFGSLSAPFTLPSSSYRMLTPDSCWRIDDWFVNTMEVSGLNTACQAYRAESDTYASTLPLNRSPIVYFGLLEAIQSSSVCVLQLSFLWTSIPFLRNSLLKPANLARVGKSGRVLWTCVCRAELWWVPRLRTTKTCVACLPRRTFRASIGLNWFKSLCVSLQFLVYFTVLRQPRCFAL